jgi:hypothetical protein
LMYCTPNLIDKWARHSLHLNKKYAEKHGYDFILAKEPYDKNVTHAWQKIPAMLELFNKGYDVVMYIDTDAMFYKHEIDLDSIIRRYEGDIIVCSDNANSGGKYKVNGGALIVKNTSAARNLLRQWWNLRYQYKKFAYEQWALSDIYENKVPGIDGSIISVAPETEFNSIYKHVKFYTNNLDTSPPDIFVLHFMAMNDEMREKAMSKIVGLHEEKSILF